MHRLMSRFIVDCSGVTAVLFGILLVPVLLGAGVALDYAVAVHSRTRLQNVADAAAMAAAANYMQTQDATKASQVAKNYFNLNCDVAGCNAAAPVVEVIPGKHVQVSFNSSVKNSVMQIADFASTRVGVTSRVALSALFQEFHMLVDRSASLGFAADPENVKKLMALSDYAFDRAYGWNAPKGCAFACHVSIGVEPYYNGRRLTMYEWAHQNNILLREDVLLGAVNTAADALLSSAQNSYSKTLVAAYAFSDSVQKVSDLTTEPTDIKAKIKASTIKNWGTRYDLVFPKMKDLIGKSGTGLTSTSPQKSLVLVTDGVWTNYNDDADSIYWTKNFMSSWCDAFKSNGVRVIVIDVQYPVMPDNYWWNDLVKPFATSISPQLEKCASPGFYYHAADSADIATALSAMVDDVKAAALHYTH